MRWLGDYIAEIVREHVTAELVKALVEKGITTEYISLLVKREVERNALLVQLGQVRAEQKRLANLVEAVRDVARDAHVSARECRDQVVECRSDTTQLAKTCAKLAEECSKILDPQVHA